MKRVVVTALACLALVSCSNVAPSDGGSSTWDPPTIPLAKYHTRGAGDTTWECLPRSSYGPPDSYISLRLTKQDPETKVFTAEVSASNALGIMNIEAAPGKPYGIWVFAGDLIYEGDVVGKAEFGMAGKTSWGAQQFDALLFYSAPSRCVGDLVNEGVITEMQ